MRRNMFRVNRGVTYKKTKNLAAIFIVLLLVHFLSYTQVYAEKETETETESIIEQEAQSREIKSIEHQLDKTANNDFREIVEDYNPKEIIKNVARGNFKLSFSEAIKKGLQYFFKELYINIHILIKLMILVVLCALLKNLQASFLSDGVGELAFYVCYIAMISLILVSFSSAISLGISIIDSMVDFMYATVPVLITLLVAGGNMTSGGIFQPILILIVEISATVIKNVFIPLILLSTILSIVNNISGKVQISRLASLLKQVAGWGLGIILTIFVAVVSIQGSVGAVADGVASKTAKFAIGTFIPVAGSYLADAADTVLSCALLIKNAAGIAVMIGVIAICLVPILKLFALIGLFKITEVLVEPISEKRITNCIKDIAGSLAFILGIIASVAFMFLISITAIIGASNLSAMIR
jgi:stage III sporulation protein AE